MSHIKANAKLNENTPLMAFSVTHLLYVIGSEVQGCVNWLIIPSAVLVRREILSVLKACTE